MGRKKSKRKPPVSATEDVHPKRVKHESPESFETKSAHIILPGLENASPVPIIISKRDTEATFVRLPLIHSCITSLSVCTELRKPVLLAGPVGCGKTRCIDFVACVQKASVCRVQISEQTDSKSLLGAYCCTETPGQFVWRPGPLLTSLTQGSWLVLEDVDRGPADLQMLLAPLFKPNHSSCHRLDLIDPTTGLPVDQHRNFRILMTRRLVLSRTNEWRMECDNPCAEFIDRHCSVIMLPALNDDSLRQLVSRLYPSLHTLLDRILTIYGCVREDLESSSAFTGSRTISPRDLLKFCARIARPSVESLQSDCLLLHAVDCFVACVPDPSRLLQLASKIAGELNLSAEKVMFILYKRSVDLRLDTDGAVMYLGRAQLPCHRTAEWEARLAGAATLSQSTGDVVAPFASTHLACTLLERLAVAVEHKEPVLLVGETGTGKTSAIQQLAHLCGRRLRVINLNQQSDSVDLLGGFKPVDTRSLVRPVRERFEALFCRTFRMDKNIGYLEHINEYFNSGQWRDLITLMQHPTRLAVERPAGSANLLHEDWLGLLDQLNQLQRRFENAAKTNQSAVGFAFIEGALVRAVQDGDWVLLDEINLAPAEMLDCLSGLLDSDHGSVTLVERGDKTPLKRNPDFHLFAAMNPSTDVGKRELPVGLRNRFTEIYVPELDPGINDSQLNPIRATDREDLAILIRAYLLPLNPSPTQLTTVVRLYAALRQAAVEGLVDGVGQKPHFSLRTLCRALVEAGRGYHGGIIRSLYEGLIFSFGSQLSRASRPVLDTLVRRYLALIHGTREQKPDHTSLSHLLSSPLPMPVHRPALKDQSSAVDYLPVEGYWVPRGPGEPRQTSPDALVDGSYVLTPSVRANLKDLARVVAAGGSLPILLQGETSVGKTSLITYLAERIGQVCYRINNHEHTEQQTYLGTYTVASATAQANMKDGTPPPLVFQHGPLVQAMRLGHWIILDELNLAPTEILEALNRVLDDNRTLFIPDTQEVIRAHPQFRLFATQNPPGLYAGRKVLSRALRNRFIELHFDPIPRGELEVILEKRCALPQSRAHRLVEVMHRLQLARCQSNVFLGKDSFITLRDLFRWAERYRLATCDLADPENCAEKRLTFFDWDAYLAEQGYLLLAGRVRNAEETRVVAEALEAVFKRPISEAKLFDLSEETSSVSKEFLQPLLSESDVRPVGFEHVVWTRDMRRMLVLIGNALKYKEPILLVGETSCGKTTVCQLFAALKHQKLHCVNCHQYTEAGDFLGGLRPIRRVSSQDGAEVDDGRLFEWVDGPLVVAMSRGEMFLLDEISLADDAVLERLNSLLEPERRLNLAERSEGAGSIGVLETNDLTAHIGFRLVATMNPGGDYGKKELSPALRNRFTEIWCPTPAFTSPNIEDFPTSSSDLQLIVVHNLKLHLPLLRTSAHLAERLSYAMVDFASWFSWALHDDTIANHLVSTRKSPPTIRDLLAWIQFMESVCSRSSNPASTPPRLSSSIDLLSACLHGACLVFLDAVDCKPIGGILEGPSLAAQGVKFLRERLESIALEHDLPVENLFIAAKYTCAGDNSMDGGFGLTSDGRMFGADPFYIDTGPSSDPNLALNSRFNFSAPTPAVNLRRLLRALQVPKRALLLEGSPGVGKTSLVLALAKATGHDVVRINLSEATEASDLLGCDLPVEGAAPGVFGWRDGPLLQGLREGRWIVLDEMNLASQSVLECLNACLDHRGELYIPELGATFKIQPGATRLFACQNPVREGGGRKGLPKSFLNRFTQVFLQPLTRADQEFIMRQLYPRLPAPVVQLMVHFNWKLADEVNVAREFGTQGGPWEFNLRDLMRWAELILKGENFEGSNPGLSVHYVYTDRMRTEADKRKIAELWNSVCRERGATDMVYYKPLGRVSLVNNILRIGVTGFDTVPTVDPSKLPNLLLLDHQRSQLESLLKILEMGWMAILVGPPGCGKRTLTNICATLVGHPLSTMHMSPTADTVELLGSLEQHEAGGHFCWIDSPLVKGMRHGHWVVIESAQLCSPSVLDRLNSVLEPDGELILSERGLDSNGRLIRLKPHPNFRLILIIDEVSGAGAGSTGVSRAMRNRGVEIAVYKDLSMTTVDLDRILTSIGIRNSVVNALTSFQALFSTACGLTCSQADHINLLDGLPLTAGLLKRPPIGALLSCSQLAESLLQNPETDEAEPRQLFLAEPEDFLTFDLDRPKTVWCWALSRALNFAYSSRQTHAKAVSVVRTLINRFLSVVSDEISLESMYHRSGGVGPRYLLHSLPQVISCGNPVAYRENHIHVVALAVSSTESSPSPPPHLVRRVLLEQANSADLGGLSGDIQAVISHVCLTLDLSDSFPQPTADPWELWPDLRWIPGWQHLTNSVGGTVLEWDRVLRTLLAVELQMQMELVPPKSSINQSLETLSSLSVLVVAHKCSIGQIPTTWLENYPGLNAILDQWTQFLQTFVAERTVERPGTSHAYWLSIIQRVGLIWTWLHQFALRPLGDPQDWSDRLDFHNQRANLSTVDVNGFIHILGAIRSVLSLPAPRVVPFTNSEFSPMTLNCVSFGKKIGELLQLLQFGELEEEDEDGLNDESLTDEGGLVHHEEVRDNPTSNLMCLWPLSMLSTLHTIDQMAEDQRQSEPLRALVRCLLLNMTRPQLMSLLSLAQPCHVSSSVQKRAVEQSLLEISEKQAFEQLCAHLDLVSTGRLLPYRSFGTLERPSLINEWRSLGQATFAITWPALSRYNLGAEPTHQTLFGWFNSQKAYRIAHAMLSSHVRSPHGATYSSCRSSSVNAMTPNPNLTDLVLKSGQLLHAVNEALVTKVHSSTVHHTPMHPDSSFSETHPDLDSLLEWIASKLQPRLSESVFMASASPDWSEILQLCEWFIGYMLKIKDDPSNSDLIGIAWTLFGCLYVRCACPVAPLDPYIVARVEEAAVATELERVDREIELRRAIRRISFGNPSGALPKDGDDSNEWFSATNLQGLVEAGLEHPWISALVTYREQLVEKSEQLAKHNVLSRGPIPLSRQVSNIQYSQLRRRLSTFVVGFTEKLLLHRCSNQGLPQLNPDSIQRWLEVASDLGEWLTEPERFHTFADIVEPLLHGVLAILRGLRIWTHYGSLRMNMKSATVTDLVGLLSTGLMSNQTVIDRPLSLNCLSSSLYLACQLTSISVRNTLKQTAIAVSLEANPSGPTQTLAFQVEFRLFSLILDLIWLHHVDSIGSHDYQLTSFMGRLLAFLNRPLARRWQQAEADRKKAAAERAALFIEAASQKHRIQGELQQGSKSKKDNARDVQADLIDPDLVEEVEWRLRFPETASLNALAEMSAESRQFGLGREEQIQQTVRKLEQVDKWLERALGETTRTWIPDESELIYWVDRTVELLLSQDTNVIAKARASEWRWHTLLSGYSMASWLTLHHSSVSLDPSTDRQSLSTLLAITAYLAQNDLRSKARLPIYDERNASLDVYRDPIPLDAASKLLTVLEHLERRVRQILHEWPGQPSLVHLITLIRRLEGFHVSDPLMKFLTGVEMIWQEMHEWEKNASRHVSLMDQIKEVCEILIEWRKMELKCWLSTLDSATSAFSNRAATLWFHLHDVFLRPPGHATSDSTVGKTQSESDRCEVLVELMENGPLGEFPMRWRLLAALRTALDIWPGLPTQDRETNKRIVGNVVWFYGQFLSTVQNEIKCLRKPIEKELRGVVHITKWGDYACFWSVKSNVDRCKRTIHKQVRNWETVLRRPVRPLFETAISVPRFECLPDADCPNMPVSSLPSALDVKNHWLSPLDFQWICNQRTMNPRFGSHFGRLPTLVPKFHVHLRRMAFGSPITHWVQQLQTGTEAWAALLTDLETCTRQLESTCPPAHLLRQLHAAKSTGKRKVTGSDNTEELNQARQWNQQFTTLQQRKRWALSQWFKVAGNPHRTNSISGENASHSCSDLDCDTTSDAVDTELMGSDVGLNSFDDNTSLLQLGLSYLRGQRYSHTGSMTPFLSQLNGDPWRYVHSHEGTDLYRIGSKEYTLPTIVCRRLACLVALRGGLPRTPGPPGATPETVSAIVTELGGPINLARLTGLADDLLNNCVVAIRSCSQLTEAANQLFAHSDAFRSSLDGKANSCSSDVAKDDVVYAPLGSDHIQLRRIRTSVKTVGQLARDALQQCTLFWGVCHQLQSITPVTTEDLKCIFGSELWDNLVAPVARPSIDVFADLCRHICTNYLDRLTAAVETISEDVNLLSASPAFLLTYPSCQIYARLSTALESFLSVSDAIVSDCRQHGSHNNVEWSLARTADRLRSEYQFLSTVVTQDPLRALHCEELSKEECGDALCVLTDNLIQSILRTLGTLYHADRHSKDMGQIDLLLQFSSEMSVSASDLISAQVNKWLTRCRAKLEQSDGDVLTSGVRLARAVFPLVDALSKAAEVRATQFWQLLDEWTRLGERVLRITGRLLVDGFCRPAGLDRSMSDEATGGMSCDNQALDSREQEGSGGGTSLTAEGVDTTGAKDVSKELECQEQIEGLMDDTQKANQADDRGAAEDESEGIEMPDDNFHGEFGDDQPLGIDEQEDELSSADETQDLENRMGDGASGASDEVFKEMWASDNEEEEPASTIPPAENDTGGVQDQTNGKQDEKGTRDSSDVQRQKKSLDTDQPAQEKNEEANLGEAESSPPPKKGPKSAKGFQNKTTVAGDEGQMLPNNEQELTPDAESEQDHSTDGDQARKEDESLAALEAKRLEDEEETTGKQTEDLPDDLPDEAMNLPSEEAANADSGKPEEESGQDEVDRGYEDQIMPLDQDAKDQTELQDPKMEDFQYNPASGDLGQDKATAGLDGAPANEDKRPTEYDHEQDSVQQLPEQTEQSTGNRGAQRVGTSQFGDLAPDQLDAEDRSTPTVKTEGTTSKRRSGLKPVSENRSQDPSATDAMKKKEILDPAKSGQVRSPEIDQEGLTDADLYEHMEEDLMDTGNDSGIRAFDSATERQRKQQTRSEQKRDQTDTDVGLEHDEETSEEQPNLIPTDVPEEQSLSSGLPLQQQRPSGKSSKGDLSGDVVESDPDARIVATLGAQRPPDSFICTRPEALVQSTAGSDMIDVSLAVELADLRSISTEDAKEAFFEWSACSARSAGLARQLCESLRLVLEPTKAARMRGDYRTGKRINMRKIIPYLASHFRKDKIWLRRSQPSQREYRILIAVDDSSSMSDNLCRQMTFDALATVVTALNLLEVGRIGVCSFGESVRILHDLQDTWIGDAGANVLAQFTFKQSRTSLIQLLQSAIKAMQMCNLPTTTGSMPSQLLLILSDGVFSEDPQDPKVQAAVRLARDSRLFPVCLILDDVRKKHSIFDLRRYTSNGKLVPYMDTFPLPFYLVLRDVTALPQLLSDALRQWFELEASFGR